MFITIHTVNDSLKPFIYKLFFGLCFSSLFGQLRKILVPFFPHSLLGFYNRIVFSEKVSTHVRMNLVSTKSCFSMLKRNHYPVRADFLHLARDTVTSRKF